MLNVNGFAKTQADFKLSPFPINGNGDGKQDV